MRRWFLYTDTPQNMQKCFCIILLIKCFWLRARGRASTKNLYNKNEMKLKASVWCDGKIIFVLWIFRFAFSFFFRFARKVSFIYVNVKFVSICVYEFSTWGVSLYIRFGAAAMGTSGTMLPMFKCWSCFLHMSVCECAGHFMCTYGWWHLLQYVFYT